MTHADTVSHAPFIDRSRLPPGLEGVPSHDTLARVMALVNAEQLQTTFAEWMKACHDVTDGTVVAIDGKTLRGSYCRGKGKGAIHMVSAFSAANGVVLGQVKTAEKSNEITAIPELLNLQGCLVTIDAMGCQEKDRHPGAATGRGLPAVSEGKSASLGRCV